MSLYDRLKQARRRAHFKSLGLRCDGKPMATMKPCGCQGQTYCHKCARGKIFVARSKLVMAMHAEYLAGATLGSIGRKNPTKSGPRTASEIKGLFRRRGLELLPTPSQCLHQLGNGGCFKAIPRKTPAQITALIAGLKSLRVPEELRREWRSWPMQKRAAFTRRLRQRLPSNMPRGKCSAGVIPFDYGTPRAHAIAHKLNAGLNSRNRVCQLFINTQGVIFENQLWFWSRKSGYCTSSSSRYPSGASRLRFLHLVLYKRHHGPIPPHHIVIFADGNKNNFTPGNLILKSRAQHAIDNKTRGRALKAAKKTTVLIHRFNRK